MKLIKYSMLGLFILSLVFVAGDSISAPIFSPFPAYYVEYLKQFKGLPGSGALLTGGYSTPSAIHWVAGSTMMSSELKTPQGNYLAEISDLLIDPANGRVSNVVITRIQGMGAKHIAIPLSAVSKTGESIFVYNAPEDVFQFPGEGPYRSQGFYLYSKQQEPMESYKASELIGANIRTSKGEDIGRINDLAIDFADEHCADLLVSHAGGTEGKIVAVRLSALSKGDGNAFVLKTTKAELEAAPTFTWSDMTNHEYTEMLSRQCRVQQ
jgi:sporulation protein YlmC with PRC-barrel domain